MFYKYINTIIQIDILAFDFSNIGGTPGWTMGSKPTVAVVSFEGIQPGLERATSDSKGFLESCE